MKRFFKFISLLLVIVLMSSSSEVFTKAEFEIVNGIVMDDYAKGKVKRLAEEGRDSWDDVYLDGYGDNEKVSLPDRFLLDEFYLEEGTSKRFIIKRNNKGGFGGSRKSNKKITDFSFKGKKIKQASFWDSGSKKSEGRGVGQKNVYSAGVRDVVLEELEKSIEIIEVEEAVNIDDFVEFVVSNGLIDSNCFIQPDIDIRLSNFEDENSLLNEYETNNTSDDFDANPPDSLDEDNVVEADIDEDNAVGADIEIDVPFVDSDLILLDADENAKAAWGKSTGEGVIVAVIDTGIDITHSAFTGKLIDGWDFFNNCPYEYDNDNWGDTVHGTHVAGIISSVAPDAKILPLKVFDRGRAYTSQIIAAIEYAKLNGATVVNCSWGAAAENLALKECMVESGLFFSAASGNNRADIGVSPVYPAAFGINNVISVGAINEDGGLCYFSNYGEDTVDIAAWGKNISSTFPNEEYGIMNGTSMAAAYVTGAAALLAADGLQPSEIRVRLMETSDNISSLTDKIKNASKLSFYNAVFDICSDAIIHVEAINECSEVGIKRTASENWQLFSASKNKQVDVGERFSMVLKEDGSVWAWGNNDYGQLGDGTTITRHIPKKIDILSNIKYIVCGYYSAFAIRNDGKIFAWGNNECGQLGDNTYTNRLIPFQLTTISDVDSISSGYYQTIALKYDKSIWNWGYNVNSPTPVNIFTSSQSDVKKIVAGVNINLALMEDGTVNSWDFYCPSTTTIEGLENIIDISSGSCHSMAIDNFGNVWEWSYYKSTWLPAVEILSPYTFYPNSICVGYDFTYAIENGKVACWNNSYWPSYEYTNISYMDISEVSQIAAKNDHALAIKTDGTLWGWGYNYDGQLAAERADWHETPIEIKEERFIENVDIYDKATIIPDYCEIEVSIDNPSAVDFFKFTATQTAKYTITTTANIDTYGYLYDEAGIASDSYFAYDDNSGENGNFKIEFECTAGTTYYIKVEYKLPVTGPYILKISYTLPPVVTWEDAKLINDDSETQASIDYLGTVNFFKFTASQTAKYIITTTANIDTYGYLYEEAGVASDSYLVYDDDSGEDGNFKIEYECTAGMTYYIKVQHYSPTGVGNYTLKVFYSLPDADEEFLERESDVSFSKGEIFTYVVAGSDIAAINSKTIAISFDGTLLEPYELDKLPTNIIVTQNPTGSAETTLKFKLVTTVKADKYFNGTMAAIKFKAKNNGTDTIKVDAQ